MSSDNIIYQSIEFIITFETSLIKWTWPLACVMSFALRFNRCLSRMSIKSEQYKSSNSYLISYTQTVCYKNWKLSVKYDLWKYLTVLTDDFYFDPHHLISSTIRLQKLLGQAIIKLPTKRLTYVLVLNVITSDVIPPLARPAAAVSIVRDTGYRTQSHVDVAVVCTRVN